MVKQNRCNNFRILLRTIEWLCTSEDYHLTRLSFIRGLGFIHCMAFLVLLNQYIPLCGEEGLLPSQVYLDQLENHFESKWIAFLEVPSVLFLGYSDTLVYILGGIGLGIALCMLAGRTNALLLFILWAIYLSFVHVGQRFYGFGWEIMLLESTFLAMFLCPLISFKRLPETPPPRIIIWLFWWLIFRVMFGAGLIKIRGDACWLDLTCMFYHYETQPVPNPISWYFHHLPEWFHELVVPFFFFAPRKLRITAAILTMLFQIILIISGNLSFLNYLTIALCIPLLDDRFLKFIFRRKTCQTLAGSRDTAPGWQRKTLIVAISALLIGLSINPISNIISKNQVMNTSFDNLSLMNTYGAFGSVGDKRFEIIIEGTTDKEITANTKWKAYEFKCKPGDVTRRPCFMSPYHYRLDWQIWFAAMGSYQQHPWLVHFVYKLLLNDEKTIGLIQNNPFSKKAPKYIRATLFRYEFTEAGRLDKRWWKRKKVREYLPPLHKDEPSLRQFLEGYGWM